ncbi:MAG TPA: chitobiase/beta-hexosaminidase C-terminal domain-containing protein [Steroidobacteraceae bacterium]
MKAAAATSLAFLVAALPGCTRHAPHGIASRVETVPYLHMPSRPDGDIPRLLSQTGVFSDTSKLIPSEGLIPYDLIVAFWSDGADKSRLIAVPKGEIVFAPTGEWRFPAGTVFVKTFELPTDATNPGTKRRLETRLLVRDAAGGVYGVVYKWRADGSDADLLDASQTEDVSVKAAGGQMHDQEWYYPSRKDCLECHTAKAGGVLGVKTRQLNRSFTYPSGIADNELRAWSHIGLLTPQVREEDLRNLPALAASDDESRSLQDRARSYLDANCSQCHRPGGTVANFDARYGTPLADQALIDGPVLIDQGIDRPRVISPHDIWRSIAYMRLNTVDDIKMPPLARETIDQRGVHLLNEWIDSMPGRAVLAPPTILPRGGSFPNPIEISLAAESGADIRYTLDGSEPGASDMRYDKPIKIARPMVLRARAYKEGFTRSIVDQAVFIVGKQP